MVFSFREEYWLGVFENRVLREVSGAEREEVTGDWRKLHNEERYDPYCSPNTTKNDRMNEDEMGGTCSTYGGNEKCIQYFFQQNLKKRDTWKTYA